jgi:hypothetical protein
VKTRDPWVVTKVFECVELLERGAATLKY